MPDPILAPLTNTVQYRGITLEICHFNHFLVHPVKSEDGCDFLTNHYDISVDCLLNPFATASNRLAAGQPGDPAALSFVNLLENLTQPRGRLLVTIGNQTILRSPRTISVNGNNREPASDALYGPNVIECSPIAFKGVKSIILRFRVETWQHPCTNLFSAMVSHRWTMTDDIDKHYFTTRTTEGKVIFLRDALEVYTLTPDDFRNVFFHPIPNNFKRDRVRASIETNGTTINYMTVDEEKPINLGLNSPIAEIKGMYTGGYDFTNLASPELIQAAVVECWGTRRATRDQLGAACQHAAAAYGLFTGALAGQNAGNKLLVAHKLTVDMVGKYARLDVALKGKGLIRAGIAWIAGYTPRGSFQEGIRDERDGTIIATGADQADAPNPPPPGGAHPNFTNSGSRGTFLTRLVAQALMYPCQPPYSAGLPALGQRVTSVASENPNDLAQTQAERE